jgi:hypothetical protein
MDTGILFLVDYPRALLHTVSGKVTAIYDELLPTIRDAIQHLTVYPSSTERYSHFLIYSTAGPADFHVNVRS